MAMDDVQKLNLDDILTLIQGQFLEYMNSEENYGKYNDYLNSNLAASKSIKNLYKSEGGLHSHKISGSSSEDLNKTIQELNKKGFILGIDLNDEEILKLSKEYANEIFEEQENNCKIDY